MRASEPRVPCISQRCTEPKLSDSLAKWSKTPLTVVATFAFSADDIA